MSAKSALPSEDDLDRVRGRLKSYVRAHWPKARFRWISADNTDDLDVAVDIGSGARFVRVSSEAALEVGNLAAHLDAADFIGAFQVLAPQDQLIVATTGLSRHPAARAFR